MPCINIEFLNLLKENYNSFPIFIETGTHNGETAFAVEPHFHVVYTIELSEKYYNSTKSKYNGNKINFILGDSSIVFEKLLPNIENEAIFFLDGHWSSGDTAKGDKDCPLIEEIQHIQNLYKKKGIIIIDDYRLFGKGPHSGYNEDWTNINKQTILDILSSRTSDIYFLDSSQGKDDRMIIHINPIES